MMIRTGLVVFFGLAALAACGSDSSSKPDAPVVGAPDAAGSAKVFTVALTTAGEPTPCASAGAGATGSATVTISADGSSIAVTGFTFSGTSAAPSAAHIHFGTATTASGPVVLNFGTGPTSPINKTFTASDYAAASGAPATFADFVTMVKAGNAAYINVHTAACPGGEIRGELQ